MRAAEKYACNLVQDLENELYDGAEWWADETRFALRRAAKCLLRQGVGGATIYATLKSVIRAVLQDGNRRSVPRE